MILAQILTLILTVGLEPHAYPKHTLQPGELGARAALAGSQEVGLIEGEPQRRSTKDGCCLGRNKSCPPVGFRARSFSGALPPPPPPRCLSMLLLGMADMAGE